MNIAIDFDKTWTADPRMFRRLAETIRKHGHSPFIVTARHGYSEDMDRHEVPSWIPIYYTYGQLKEKAMSRMGITIDIWIDDMPGMIQECKIIGGEI